MRQSGTIFVSLFFLAALSFSYCGKKSSSPGSGQLMVVNASPGFGPADLYMDGNKFIPSSLAYPSNSGYVSLPEGGHVLKATSSGSTTTLFEGNLTTLADVRQSLYLYDRPASLKAFALLDNFGTPPAGKAYVRFFHLSPSGPTFNAGVVTGGVFTPLFADRTFENSSSAINHSTFSQVDAGNYKFELRVSGAGNTLLTVDNLALEAGKTYTLFAKGIPGDPSTPLGLEVIVHN